MYWDAITGGKEIVLEVAWGTTETKGMREKGMIVVKEEVYTWNSGKVSL